jgi:GT2 family glycosyltransferase
MTLSTGKESAMPEISVVLSTYNRAAMLPRALDALLAQRMTTEYEVVVVNNNSTDSTAALISRYASHDKRVRTVYEPTPGASSGRNAGIAIARAPLIAFTDDDTAPGEMWLRSICRAFEQWPDAAYIGGRVLPRGPLVFPSELVSDAAPFALTDYGEDVLRLGDKNRMCMIGANMAFRRETFARVGLFAPHLGVRPGRIGSVEDADMQRRCWAAGLRGYYVPGIVVHHTVGAERLTRAYHRRWHRQHGRFMAEARDPDIEVGRSLLGIPGHLWRQAANDAVTWPKSFAAECRLWMFLGFAWQRCAFRSFWASLP